MRRAASSPLRALGGAFVAAWLLWSFAGVGSARADAPALVVSDTWRGGIAVGRHLDWLVDASGTLDVDEVASPRMAARFVVSAHDSPSFGFTKDVLWLRLRVDNRDQVARPWLLELAYPHVDFVTLYEPRADGSFSERASGDMLPFARREFPYRNVVFALEQPALAQRTYYLRLRTEGSMIVPLRAWTLREFFDGQGAESAVIWMFHGLTLVMCLYNLFLFMFVRQREYLLYSIYVFAMGAMNFTLFGHTFQYVLSDYPALASCVMPATIAVLLGSVALFADACLKLPEVLPTWSRLLTRFYAPAMAVLALASFGLSYSTALRITAIFGFSLVVLGPLLVYATVRTGSRPAKIFFAAWACLIVGAAFHYLELVGVVPSFFVTRWGIQIGASAETVLLSLALAERINGLRADLSRLNGKLTENVADLQLALTRAEHATRAKSEFLATMSHELRTPLNAIINIPPSIVERFRRLGALQCESCAGVFALEPGEVVAADASCPECKAQGSLRPRQLAEFTGDGIETMQHLRMVERAGKHLLQMVNGVLDFSKMEAGRVELALEKVSVAALLSEALDTVAPLAARAEVELRLLPGAQGLELRADGLRVKQVLINLLGNAVKFSSARAVVEVGAERRGDDLLLHVRDRGIGIARQDLARIFRTFEQVDQGDTRRYGGTGLGLSISRSLVELHGGEIWVQSELGKGSTFFVRLPIAGPAAPQAAANGNAAQPQARIAEA
jgi:signal transduction histidine kinase